MVAMILALVAVAAVPASAAKIASGSLNASSMMRTETTALIPLTAADGGKAEAEDGRHAVRRQEEKVRWVGRREGIEPARGERANRDEFQERLWREK